MFENVSLLPQTGGFAWFNSLNPPLSLRTVGLFTSVKLAALGYTSMED